MSEKETLENYDKSSFWAEEFARHLNGSMSSGRCVVQFDGKVSHEADTGHRARSGVRFGSSENGMEASRRRDLAQKTIGVPIMNSGMIGPSTLADTVEAAHAGTAGGIGVAPAGACASGASHAGL